MLATLKRWMAPEDLTLNSDGFLGRVKDVPEKANAMMATGNLRREIERRMAGNTSSHGTGVWGGGSVSKGIAIASLLHFGGGGNVGVRERFTLKWV